MRKATVLMVVLAAWLASSSNAAPPQQKVFGFMDDGHIVPLAAQMGASVVKRTVWIGPTNNSWDNPGDDPRFLPIPEEHRQAIDDDMQAARQAGIKVILELYPVIKYGLPQNPAKMRGTCDVAKDLAIRYADVLYGIEVGVEPNNYTFNHRQYNPDGTQASAANYEHWLAACYDKIKSAEPDVMVIGGSLASTGEDDPHKPTSSTSPVVFIQKFCQALADSGRTTPVMDILDMHNYPNPQDQDPRTKHPYPSTTITIADSDKLDGLLDCFTRIGLPKPPYIWGEGGYNTPVPDDMKHGKPYTGQKPDAAHLVDPVTQGKYDAAAIQMAYCQKHSLGWLNFKLVDDVDLGSQWQSGVVYAPRPAKRRKTSAQVAYTYKKSWTPVRDALTAVRDGTMTCG